MTTLPPSKVALITGAGQRLGANTARFLHAKGWRILVHCRHSRTEADTLADALNTQRSDSCHVLQADLGKLEDIHVLAEQAEARWQRVDALINNASAFYPTPIGNATENDWNTLFSSNAHAPFFLSQALTPALSRHKGCIINMVDIHAEKPLKEHTLYCMAKAALAMMTRSLAKELAPHVRVNGIAPGAILWPSNGEVDTETQARILAGIPMSALGTPDDIARTIAFLLDDAPYITGQIIAVDGGRSL